MFYLLCRAEESTTTKWVPDSVCCVLYRRTMLSWRCVLSPLQGRRNDHNFSSHWTTILNSFYCRCSVWYCIPLYCLIMHVCDIHRWSTSTSDGSIYEQASWYKLKKSLNTATSYPAIEEKAVQSEERGTIGHHHQQSCGGQKLLVYVWQNFRRTILITNTRQLQVMPVQFI